MDQLPYQHTKEGLLNIINALPMSITVLDKNRRVTLSNTATTQLINKGKNQLIGLVGGEAFDCIHHESTPEGCGFGLDCIECKLRQTVLETMEKKEPRQMVETSMTFKNIGKRQLRISTLPLILDNEEVVLLSIEDITRAKRHEMALMEKEKLTIAVETVGGVCHEINQPLMVIMGMAEILLEEVQDLDPLKSDDFKSGLAEIKAQGERLGKITRKLMNLTEYKTRPYLKNKILDLQEEDSDTPPDS